VSTPAKRPDYVTPDGTEVWMERKNQKTRFLDAAGRQVGPVHRNLVPAVVWARCEGWTDPSAPQWLNDGVIAEVRAGGVLERPATPPVTRHHEPAAVAETVDAFLSAPRKPAVPEASSRPRRRSR
jgi:hypothetical protein